MSENPKNIDKPESTTEKPEIIAQAPKSKVHSVLQELEVMALQKGSKNTLDISKLDKEQLDRLLDTLAENERNAFAYHTKRIDAIKEIEIKRIDASVINQKTVKVVFIGGLLVVVPVLTGLILFFKETYFIPWLTFLTGIIGGFGLSKMTANIFKQPNSSNPIKEDDD